MNDSTSSFTRTPPRSRLHWKDSLGMKAVANQRRPSEDKPKKCVSFGDITIREHPMIVGDSVPPCGVPLTIDWEAQSEVVLKVEDYEEYRPAMRRRVGDMIMPSNVRLTLAMNSGCTLREVHSVLSECERIRKERRNSLPRSEKWSRISEVMMRTKYIFKKNVTGAKSA